MAGIPSELERQENGELLYELAAILARRGLGTPEMYDPSKGVGLFVQTAVGHAIGKKRLKTIGDSISYGVELADSNRPHYFREKKEPADYLLLKVSCSEFGYLEIGGAIEAMGAEAPGLGVAFYWVLINSIHPVMRIYDYSDAMYC